MVFLQSSVTTPNPKSQIPNQPSPEPNQPPPEPNQPPPEPNQPSLEPNLGASFKVLCNSPVPLRQGVVLKINFN